MELTIYRCGYRIKMDSEDFDLRRSKISGKPKSLSVDVEGYIHFRHYYMAGKAEKLHRLVAGRMIGRKLLKTEAVDHINGDKLDNRRCNLRIVTSRQNSQNRKLHRNGRLVGCYFKKQRKKWVAQLRLGKNNLHLGYYNTELEAHEAYMKALKEEGLS